MGYTFGSLGVVEGLDVLALPDHVESLFGEIHVCQNILPFVVFADQEFILGGESNSAALTNETAGREDAILPEPASSHANCLETRRLPPARPEPAEGGARCVSLF